MDLRKRFSKGSNRKSSKKELSLKEFIAKLPTQIPFYNMKIFLTGSLIRGRTTHDIDLIIEPKEKWEESKTQLRNFFEKLFLVPIEVGFEIWEKVRPLPIKVLIYENGRKCIHPTTNLINKETSISMKQMFGQKILNYLKRILPEEETKLGDSIQLKDFIQFKLVKDGKVLKKWSQKGHTLLSGGEVQIVDWFTSTEAGTPINKLEISGSEVSATAYDLGNSFRVQGTFPAAWTLSNITAITSRYNTTDYFTTSVTSFDKDPGVSLEVKITVQIS